MSAQTGSATTVKENVNPNESAADKGKGKAIQDVSMEEDESSSEEEVDEVCCFYIALQMRYLLTNHVDC